MDGGNEGQMKGEGKGRKRGGEGEGGAERKRNVR